MYRHSALTILIAAAALMAACYTRPAGPTVYNDPCADSTYVALKAQPVDSLTERQYETLQRLERDCVAIQRLVRRNGSADQPTQRPLDLGQIRTWTEPSRDGGAQEIHMRNEGQVTVWITRIVLTACTNLKTPCGPSTVRVRLEPGQSRRIMTVEFRSHSLASSYQYSYEVQSGPPR